MTLPTVFRPVSLFALTSGVVVMACNAPAHAEDSSTAPYTRLEIHATGTTQAAPDKLSARFRAESQNKNAASAQRDVNAVVKKATDEAAKNTDIKAAVLQYSVYETRPEKARPYWTASQTLSFSATDGKSLLPLAGQLQAQGLILEGLDWSLSDEKRQSLFLDAEKQTVAELKKQADTLAASLGLHVARFTQISVSDQGYPHPMPIMLRAAPAGIANDSISDSPSSTAETQTVRADLRATVLLAP
ncbi:SIMPL domain-containing protein [Acetobacter sp. LMG 32666]|uniref:SIMPL domain-containing protein n=1 Tax=Acetobacter sp. LMG 32666 TaxID=2959295 RepID=UPI0030C8A005